MAARIARDLSVSLNNLGDFYLRRGGAGDGERALSAYEESLATRRWLYEQNPQDAQAARDLVVACYGLAGAVRQSARPQDAGAVWRECHQVLKRMREAGMELDPPLQDLAAKLDAAFKTSQ